MPQARDDRHRRTTFDLGHSPRIVEGELRDEGAAVYSDARREVSQPVKVKLATANGTATTTDNDYVERVETLTFAPGETTKSSRCRSSATRVGKR
jgi:hypothetical protein